MLRALIDETGAHPINLGTTTATQINISRTGQLTNVGGTLTTASTLTVTGTTPASALVVSPIGNVTAQGIGTFGPTVGNQLVVQGAATGSVVQLSSTGSSDAETRSSETAASPSLETVPSTASNASASPASNRNTAPALASPSAPPTNRVPHS